MSGIAAQYYLRDTDVEMQYQKEPIHKRGAVFLGKKALHSFFISHNSYKTTVVNSVIGDWTNFPTSLGTAVRKNNWY